MAVKITASMDDKISPELKKMGKALDATGKEADEFTESFRDTVREIGLTEKEIKRLDDQVEKLGKTSKVTGNRIRYELMEELKTKKLADFRAEVKRTADSIDMLGNKSKMSFRSLTSFGAGMAGGIASGFALKFVDIIKEKFIEAGLKSAISEAFALDQPLGALTKLVNDETAMVLHWVGLMSEAKRDSILLAEENANWAKMKAERDKRNAMAAKLQADQEKRDADAFTAFLDRRAEQEKDNQEFIAEGIRARAEAEKEANDKAIEAEKQRTEEYKREIEERVDWWTNLEKSRVETAKQLAMSEANARMEIRRKELEAMNPNKRSVLGGVNQQDVNKEIIRKRQEANKEVFGRQLSSDRVDFMERSEKIKSAFGEDSPQMKQAQRDWAARQRGLSQDERRENTLDARNVMRGRGVTDAERVAASKSVFSRNVDRGVAQGRIPQDQAQNLKDLAEQESKTTYQAKRTADGIKELASAIDRLTTQRNQAGKARGLGRDARIARGGVR